MWFDLSQHKFSASKGTLDKVILAEVGNAKGHTTKSGLQIAADATTLAMWLDLIKKSMEPIAVTLNHSSDVRDLVGELVKETAAIEDNKLVCSIKFLKAAYERSTNFIGEYLESIASEENSFINVSVETESELEEIDDKAVIRPSILDCASIVLDGALTHKLQNFSAIKQTSLINKDKETHMPEETKKEEVKTETVKLESVKAEEVKTEIKAEEVKAEEVKAAEPTLADVVAKLDALTALVTKMCAEDQAAPVEDMAAKVAEAEKQACEAKEQLKSALAAKEDAEKKLKLSAERKDIAIEEQETNKLDLSKLSVAQLMAIPEVRKQLLNSNLTW